MKRFDWMVQLMKSGNLKPEPETTSCRDKVPVKLEIVEDSIDEEHGPLNKRSKASPSLQQVLDRFRCFFLSFCCQGSNRGNRQEIYNPNLWIQTVV